MRATILFGVLLAALLGSLSAPAQVPLPEFLYYSFEEVGGSGTINLAAPGGGAPVATVSGTMGGSGMYGAAFVGEGGLFSYVDTGLNTTVTGSWAVQMWIDISADPGSVHWFFGTAEDNFRARHDPAIGQGDMIVETATTLTIVPGGAPSGGLVTFIHDATVPCFIGYVNGIEVFQQFLGQTVPLTFSNFFLGRRGPPGTSTEAMGAGVKMDEFRFYDRLLTLPEIIQSSQSLLAAQLPATWQTNQYGSKLDINGVNNGIYAGVDVEVCSNHLGWLNASSTNLGLPWELIISLAPGIPAGSGALTSATGQIINADIAHPTTVFLFNLGFSVPFAPFSIPVVQAAPLDVYSQMINLDPSKADGISISAHCGLHVVPGAATIPGPTTDDGSMKLLLGTPPFCGPSQVTFAGTIYSELYVNANGSVTFNEGSLNASPIPNAFGSGPPRLAGMWCDLDPSASGAITISDAAGVMTVSYQGVQRNPYAVPVSVDLVFDTTTGGCSIENYSPAGFGGNSGILVGLSPGNGALSIGGSFFSIKAGQGPQTNLTPQHMVYQYAVGTAPSGFSSISFPNSDASIYIVN